MGHGAKRCPQPDPALEGGNIGDAETGDVGVDEPAAPEGNWEKPQGDWETAVEPVAEATEKAGSW